MKNLQIEDLAPITNNINKFQRKSENILWDMGWTYSDSFPKILDNIWKPLNLMIADFVWATLKG
jgi:hypothetical protein